MRQGYASSNNYTVYYYITNLQGDVIRLVDVNGSTAAYYEYDPYGNAIQAAGSHCNINPLRYRGYVYDTESGLYYLQSRYYDPKICRFINADAFASTGQGFIGYNMFAYCNNSPVNYTDNYGMSATATMEEGLMYLMAFLAALDSATPFLEAAAIIGTVFTVAAIAINARQKSEKEEAKPVADATTATLNWSDVVIYRYYASKTENLAPRPGIDYDGLSFSTKPPKPGVKAVQTTIGAVNATGILHVTLDKKGHVTVKPKGAGTVVMWMAMGQSSPWSQALSLIVTEIEG